jgi:cation diffusion facilitator CzcD-associated flavoprotein CzcO
MSDTGPGATSHGKVGIIGAGPGGLGLAIRLVMDAYYVELAEALDGTLWHDGSSSYLKNAAGKIATQLPQMSRWYADQTKRFDMKEYERV